MNEHHFVSFNKITLRLMKALLFLLLISVSTAITAQSSDGSITGVPTNPPSKFIFGWFYSPEISYRTLSESDLADEFTPILIEQRNEREGVKFGQSFNFFFGYHFASRFRLEVGLGFTDYGEARKATDLVSVTNPFSAEVIGTITGSNHILVSTLPICLQFQMGKGNGEIRPFVTAGITPGILTRYITTSKTKYTDGNISNGTFYSPSIQDDYSKFILSANISTGIEYRYTEKASLRIAPVFRITTSTVYSGGPVRGHYFNAGIEFGTVYHL